MIALVTDSASQIPPELAERFDVTVVPVRIAVDGKEYQEGVDLSPDEMWGLLTSAGETSPTVKTSQPPPGDFIDAYESLAEAGATDIVSVHVGEAFSGTLNSARLAVEALASRGVAVNVHLVDSETASFGVTCCLWEAATALASGATAVGAADRAAQVAPTIGTAFIVQAVAFAEAGGRYWVELPVDADGVIVLAGTGADIAVVSSGRSVHELCDQMVERLLAPTGDLRVGVGLADPSTVPFVDGIEERLASSGRSLDVVRYRVGPSIAAHTGPGTAGGFSYPVPN